MHNTVACFNLSPTPSNTDVKSILTGSLGVVCPRDVHRVKKECCSSSNFTISCRVVSCCV